LRDVAITTMCPHHLMPAFGKGTVAYAPHGKLVGLGFMAELLDAFAHRLILQEEIGERVAATLADELGARWVACRLVLSHTCVTARGERKHGATAETVAFLGDAAGRAEAIAVVGAGA
jgi:GTP cyclohydrolase I